MSKCWKYCSYNVYGDGLLLYSKYSCNFTNVAGIFDATILRLNREKHRSSMILHIHVFCSDKCCLVHVMCHVISAHLNGNAPVLFPIQTDSIFANTRSKRGQQTQNLIQFSFSRMIYLFLFSHCYSSFLLYWLTNDFDYILQEQKVLLIIHCFL